MTRTTTDHAVDDLDMQRVGAFAEQVAGTLTGGVTTAMMMLGDRLGLYAALARFGATTSAQLAEATGTAERYVREWLAQQAAVGFVDYDAMSQIFTLPAEHAAVLATDDSPASMIGCTPLVTGMHRRTDAVAAAFRTGEGIAWEAHDATIYEATERFFGASYRARLVPEWIPALEGVHERLTEGAFVADIGCGRGVAPILLAEAYPRSRFVGFDVHEPSIEAARTRAARADVSDRVRFEVAHCHGYPADAYDLITFFDAFHDLGDPVGAAEYARSALADGGALMLVEPLAGEDLADTLALPGAGINYAASTFLCTPNSLSQPVGLALGAQAGEPRLREVLDAAGFATVRRVADTDFHMVVEATTGRASA